MEAVEPEPRAKSSRRAPALAGQTPASERLTGRQVEAVYAVMRLLRDDGGAAVEGGSILCDRCHRERHAQGSVAYGTSLLCNGCATDYELLRAARSVRRIEDFLGTPPTVYGG